MISPVYREEDFEKKFSLRLLQTLNSHLPAKRKTLKELLSEDKPSITNKDRTAHFFDKKELERLASIVPEQEHRLLRLPLYLEMSASMERGTVRISGRIECMVIKKILDDNETYRREDAEGQDSMIIYYPHLIKIRKEFSTTTQFMFTM